MQHELFGHPNPKARRDYPLIVVMQSDMSEGEERIVAPLVRATPGAASPMRPLVCHDGDTFVVVTRLLGSIPIRQLQHPVGSIAQYRDDLSRALDWLFFGI